MEPVFYLVREETVHLKKKKRGFQIAVKCRENKVPLSSGGRRAQRCGDMGGGTVDWAVTEDMRVGWRLERSVSPKKTWKNILPGGNGKGTHAEAGMRVRDRPGTLQRAGRAG